MTAAGAAVEPRLRRSAIVAGALALLAFGSSRDASTIVLPYLLGVAALCVVGLARRTIPTIAWLGAIQAAFAFASLPIAGARGADPSVLTFGGWMAVAAPAGVAAVATMWVATEFATRPERPSSPFVRGLARALLGWLILAIVVTWVAAATGQRSDPAFTWVDVATYPIAWYVPLVALVTSIGVAAELRWAWARAIERGVATPAQGGPARAWALAVATFDELVPGRGAATAASVAAERRQLAGDLHASVVPSLRRAIDEAEGHADPAVVLRHLRAADLELERLMADRWPIVLETFGLVAAVEDLAERLEAGGSPPITIGVEGSEARPPQRVERAAWRVVQVALDNAVRHASAAAIGVELAIDASSAGVRVEDDGTGFEVTGTSRGRGLADARGAAADVGALVSVVRRDGGGTVVDFQWPATAS